MSVASFGQIVALMILVDIAAVILVLRSPPQRLSLRDVGGSGRRSHGGKRDELLFAFRLAMTFYSIAVFVCTATLPPDLYFFTTWSWILLMLYFSLASAASFLHLRWKSEVREDLGSGATLAAPGSFANFARLCQVTLSALSGAALTLDVILWTILSPSDPDPLKRLELCFMSYNMHAGNLLFIALEFAGNNITLRRQDLVFAWVWPALFCQFTFVRIAVNPATVVCLTKWDDGGACYSDLKEGQIVWPYFFMDTAEPWALFWYLCLLVLFCLAYMVMVCVARRCRPWVEIAAAQQDAALALQSSSA
jgi:hypothetical protein